ncbi:hypothetical protein K7432_010953 [Basidiobolus ranarum]|uniref:Uncharacterized protein n=1 Tax=Basidiobolus ranarum TaxID=34480 RepID=A0ABR2WN23_9FUNG
MKFQTSVIILAFLVLYSMQIAAQHSASGESDVSIPTATDSIDPDVSTTVAEPDSVLPSTDDSPVEPTDSSDDSVPTGDSSDSVPNPGEVDPTDGLPDSTDSDSQPGPSSASSGGECQDGQYQCSGSNSPDFQWCVDGAWVSNTCSEGTICKPVEGDSIACDWQDGGEAEA